MRQFGNHMSRQIAVVGHDTVNLRRQIRVVVDALLPNVNTERGMNAIYGERWNRWYQATVIAMRAIIYGQRIVVTGVAGELTPCVNFRVGVVVTSRQLL